MPGESEIFGGQWVLLKKKIPRSLIIVGGSVIVSQAQGTQVGIFFFHGTSIG